MLIFSGRKMINGKVFGTYYVYVIAVQTFVVSKMFSRPVKYNLCKHVKYELVYRTRRPKYLT